MLILSRKVGERIMIGNGIEIVVQRVQGERVTLGIAAPSHVKILRGELVLPPINGTISQQDPAVQSEPVAAHVCQPDPQLAVTGSLFVEAVC